MNLSDRLTSVWSRMKRVLEERARADTRGGLAREKTTAKDRKQDTIQSILSIPFRTSCFFNQSGGPMAVFEIMP